MMASQLKNYCCIAFLFTILMAAESCKKKPAPVVAPVATLQSTASFRVGAAVVASLLQSNYAYQGVVVTEYNSVTTGNDLKFNAIEPQQGVFDYAAGDYIIAFAQQNHMRVHAHNLIWNQALPDWVLNFQGDSAAWENIFKTHIQSEVAHYKGEVASWDVVNEAIRDDNGALRDLDVTPGDGTGSIWYQHLGPGYVARAFQYAHAADPDALLFYNDSGDEWPGSLKLDSILALVTRLQAQGVPINGIGMEMHIDIVNTVNADITSAMQRLAATGLKIHVSELDIAVNPNNNPNMVYTNSIQAVQAAKYQFVAQTYRATVPAAQQYGITTWDVGDADSWIPVFYIRKDWPLPFDSVYKKKQAYYGYLAGLK
jgi:endo-1,4-beta-xylanase